MDITDHCVECIDRVYFPNGTVHSEKTHWIIPSPSSLPRSPQGNRTGGSFDEKILRLPSCEYLGWISLLTKRGKVKVYELSRQQSCNVQFPSSFGGVPAVP